MSVTAPTNVKAKQASIDEKLRLYGVYCGFANGRLPSNEQIDVAMNSAVESSLLAKPSKELSEEGRHLVGDVQGIIRQANQLFLTKNKGELLQKFIYHAMNISDQGGVAGVDAQQGQADANRLGEGLRTLGTLLVTNGEFRKLLQDAVNLFRDIAADQAQRLADQTRPSEEQMNSIDKPAPENQWHEMPDFEGYKNKALRHKETAQDAKDQAQEQGKEELKDAGDKAQAHDDPQAGAQAAGDHLANRADQFLSKAADQVPSEHIEKAKQVGQDAHGKAMDRKDDVADYLKKKMPEERRDQTIYRLKKMVVEIQRHDDYQTAIDTVLDLASKYESHAERMSKEAAKAADKAHTKDDHVTEAERNIKLLIERFANYTSLDDLMDAIDQIYQDSRDDPQLRYYFSRVNKYVRKCLKTEGFVLRDEANEEWNKLYKEGDYLTRDKYRTHFDNVGAEFELIGEQFGKDPDSVRFGNSMQKLFDDLGTDENGKAAFKPYLVTDVFNVVLPTVFERIRYVPIPRIEYSDPQADVIIENLVFEASNIFPTNIEISTSQFHRYRMHKTTKNIHKQEWTVKLSEIQADLKDVSYYVKKKEGFPSITDKGVADIYLGGTGLSAELKIALNDAKSSKNHFFDIKNCVVTAANLRVNIKETQHRMLFRFSKNLLLRTLRPVVEKVAAQRIREIMNDLDYQLYRVQKRVDLEKQHIKENPEDAQNIFNMYWNAAQQRIGELRAAMRERQTQGKANVAVTKKDSMFKNISLPGGISTAATEQQERAKKGETWHSEVFTLGQAKPSTSIPDPKPITRKSPRQYQGRASATVAQAHGSSTQG